MADLGDVLLQPADHPRREPAVHERPLPGVLRRVHVEHHQPLQLDLGLRDLAEQASRAAEENSLRVPGHVRDVLVPGHGPEAGPARLAAVGVPEDRVVLAQPGELLVRRPAALVGVRVDEIDLRRRHITNDRAIPSRS